MTTRKTTTAVAIVVASVALLAAGCGGNGSASGTASVQGTTFATTIGTTTSATSNPAACRELRATARNASSAVHGVFKQFANVGSRAQLLNGLDKLHARFQAAAAKTAGIQVSSPPLVRDRNQLSSGLNLLAQQVAQARSAVANGNLAAAARMSGGAGLKKLGAATSDLSHRCTPTG